MIINKGTSYLFATIRPYIARRIVVRAAVLNNQIARFKTAARTILNKYVQKYRESMLIKYLK